MSVLKFHGLFLVIILFVFASCRSGSLSPEEHEQEVLDWHEDRIERLLERQGWISLAGMEDVAEGENSFGSDRSNDIIFPPGDMPRFAGKIIRDGEKVSLYPDEETQLFVEDELFTGGEIYNSGNAKTLTIGTVDFLIIQRSEIIAVRIFDEQSPYRVGFTGLELKPIDLDYRVTARFVENEEPTTIPVANVLGQTNDLVTPGTLYFELNGEEHSLAALEATDSLFLIIGDESNRSTTYGGGRYMYVDLPNARGEVIIDFNKLYNPPCAMNPYSTCNLPPAQNRLDTKIDAGEKRYRLPDMTASR